MDVTNEQADADLGYYFAVLRRRWLAIVGTMVLVVAGTLAFSLTEKPTYRASSQLLLQSTKSESIFQPTGQTVTAERALLNEIEIMNSAVIRKAVEEEFGKPVVIRAETAGENDVIMLSATSTDPKDAARRVNVYAKVYQQTRLDGIVTELSQAKVVLQQQLDDFQAAIDKLNEPLAVLDARIVTVDPVDPSYAQLQEERLRLDEQIAPRRNELQSRLNDYQQRLQILQVSERLTTTGGVQILNPASVPTTPISPNPTRDAVQALLIGLVLGIAVAFLRDQLDDSIRSPIDVERVARNVPSIALIPLDDEWRNRTEERLSILEAPMSTVAEAYRGLRTALQYIALDRPIQVLQVTSSTAAEGKSTIAANLAMAFAEAGVKVAIVGCDLRLPRIHRFFGVDGSVGLTSVLLGQATIEQALQKSPSHPNVSVLPSGPRPPNPSELLSLERTSEIIRSLAESHDIVFVDSPPVLPVTDSLVLTRCVDAVIFGIRAGSTTRRQVKRAIGRLEQVNSPLVGTVLVGVAGEGSYGSMNDYYGYIDEGPPLRRRRSPKTDVPRTESSGLPNEQAITVPPNTSFKTDG